MIIFVIVVFAVFKKPTVEYLGIQSDPKFTLNQGAITLGIDFVANLRVNNPNPIGIDVDSIVPTVSITLAVFAFQKEPLTDQGPVVQNHPNLLLTRERSYPFT